MIKQFQRSFTNDDGTTEIWKYDLDKFPKGPIETTTIYPKGWQSPLEIIKGKNKKLPLSQQQFLNPATGKMVAYFRAKQLGLI